MKWALKEKLQGQLQKEQIAFSIPSKAKRNSFLLAYPNYYNVGMSNLGFHTIYRYINLRKDTVCERIFMPNRRDEDEYVRTMTPLLSLETQYPMYQFSLIGFAVSFEMDYFHLLRMLELGRVPIRADQRKEQDPIVIAGGPCITFNPEPLAEFLDICIIGEGEETIQLLLDLYYKYKEQGWSRSEILKKATTIPGIYVPSLYTPSYTPEGKISAIDREEGIPEKVERQWIEELDQYPAKTAIVTDDTEFSKMYLVEIARGCGRHCRFCMAGYCFRRPRNRSMDSLQQDIAEASLYRSKIGLVGAAISDHPNIHDIFLLSEEAELSVSVASLRADSISDDILSRLKKSGHKTITLAPEAATQEMRDRINKNLTDGQLQQAISSIIRHGISNIRLYIMIGLPGCDVEEAEQIVAFARKIKQWMKEAGSRGKLTLSVNVFIPKPSTPFQWEPMCDEKSAERKMRMLKELLRIDAGIEVLCESLRESYVQAILARGDRRLSDPLQLSSCGNERKSWDQAMKKFALDKNDYLNRTRGYDEIFPWDRLDMGVRKEYLWKEKEKAAEGSFTKDCYDGCRRCGVC